MKDPAAPAGGMEAPLALAGREGGRFPPSTPPGPPRTYCGGVGRAKISLPNNPLSAQYPSGLKGSDG